MLRLRLGEDENVVTLPEAAEVSAASPVSLSIADCTLALKLVKADQGLAERPLSTVDLRPH